jgi:hypothetical protein
MFVIFLTVFAGLAVVSFWWLPEWWGLLVFILLASMWLVLFAKALPMVYRAGARHIAKSWPDLARAAGLTYEPDDHSLWGDRYPALRGEYRGRFLMMGFARAGYSYSISSLEASVPTDNPRFSLAVKNPANIRFTMQPKGFFVRASRIEAVTNGDEDFDSLFVIKGEPGDYVKSAVQWIIASGSRTLNCLRQNVSSIELNGSYLVCAQGRALAIENQIALFNLLCNLAELAEKWEASWQVRIP